MVLVLFLSPFFRWVGGVLFPSLSSFLFLLFFASLFRFLFLLWRGCFFCFFCQHTANDRYWGDGGDGRGKNRLGIVLMRVREHIRKQLETGAPTAAAQTQEGHSSNSSKTNKKDDADGDDEQEGQATVGEDGAASTKRAKEGTSASTGAGGT